MMEFISEVYRRQPVLAVAGIIHVSLALIMLLGLAIDSRSILGLNPWVKPLKFAVSLAVYLFTIALFMSYFPSGSRLLSLASVTIVVTIILETALISMQALRGTTSHFNISTPFDTAVFALMGIAIVVNTVALVGILWQFFTHPPNIAPAYLWGIRLGLIVFILAGLQGFMMASRGAHTVGAPDGGPGLPFVNWSTRFGDLRVAHFVGLHALQIIPFAGYLFSGGNNLENSSSLSIIAVFGVTGLIGGIMAWALAQALGGKPLIHIG